jgi:DNA-binding NtrC family response regulator
MGQVLIVDDESDILEILQDVLSLEFEKIHLATDAKKALEIIKANDIDIVLTDFHMPGVAGDELVRLIRSAGLQTPVVFITGDASRDLAMSSVRLGVSDILEKPFKADNVVEVIHRVLEIEKRKQNLFEVAATKNSEAIAQHKKVLGLLQAVNDKKRMA